jgi:hypothetical protein
MPPKRDFHPKSVRVWVRGRAEVESERGLMVARVDGVSMFGGYLVVCDECCFGSDGLRGTRDVARRPQRVNDRHITLRWW